MNSKLKTGLRIFLGVVCVVFGLNPFLQFIPLPPMSGDAGTLMDIYQTSGFMKFISVIQIIAGLGLIFGKYKGFSLILLVAIFFNATIFHVFHEMAGFGTAGTMLLLSLILALSYREEFSSLVHEGRR